MQLYPTVVAVLALFLAPFGQNAAGTWQRIVADWETFDRFEDPLTAGAEGDRAALAKLSDITPEGDARRLTALKTFKSRLDAVNARSLAADDAFNHAFLARDVNERIARAAYDPARLSFTNEGGPGSNLGYYARTTAVSSRADADAWLSA